MKHKLIALVLIVLTIATMFVGCGKKETITTPGETASPEATIESSEPAVKEDPYTVTMVMRGTQPKDEAKVEAKINEILKKELNTKLDIVVLPWGSAAQQIQLMLSGDEKIDLLADFSNDAITKMNNGQIVDITNLVEQYGTNIKSIFNEEVINACSLNGFTYGVPTQIERGSVPCVFLRKDIVDKYNLDLSQIKEPKDMEKIFELVKAQEPEMTMLYSASTDDIPLDRLNSVDKLIDNDLVLENQTENTTITNIYASEWYKETATMLHDWYNKGYINQDAGTSTVNWRDSIKSGSLFSLFYAYHPATKIEIESSTGCEFEVVLFMDKAIKNCNSFNNVMYVVAQNSENPEKAMQTLDYIYGSKEVMDLLNWGIEGEDYVYVDQDKNVINYPDGVTIDNVEYSLNLGWELPNQFIANLWAGSDPDLWKKMQEWNDSAVTSKALGFTFDATGLETQMAAINNVVNQYHGAIASGAVDPEEYIPEFLTALEDAGINDVLKEKQTQFDAWLENK